MLVYLCDRCHGPVSQEEAKRAEGKGDTLLCPACREKENQTAPPPRGERISCEDCQVAVSQNAVPGGRWGDAGNVFCSTCEKITGRPGKKFRCHVCRSLITLEDLRKGRAVSVAEKAYCSTCRRRIQETQPPPSRPKPVALPRITPSPFAIPKPRPKTKRLEKHAIPSPAPPGSPLECDLCRRSFTLKDLRTGKAEIREARVLCPRCIARIDRTKRRFDFRFAAALVFILVVFPGASALLVHLALSARLRPETTSQDPGADQSNSTADHAGLPEAPVDAPSTPPSAAQPTDPPPAEAGAKNPVGIGADDIRQILRNLSERPQAGGGAVQAPSLEAPAPGSSAPRPVANIEDLRDMSSSSDPAVRLEGVLRTAAGEGGTGILVRALEDEDPFVRSAAAAALGKRRERSAIGPLLGLIRDPDFMVRKAASLALVDTDNIRFKYAEDFSAEELEGLQKYIRGLLEKKQAPEEDGSEDD